MFVHTATITPPGSPLNKKQRVLLQRQESFTGAIAATPSALDDADHINDTDGIPTIVLSPELAIQPLDDMFSQCIVGQEISSGCPGLPVLRATSIDSSASSQTVLFGRDEQNIKPKKRQRAAYVSATVIKESQEAVLGLGLRKDANGSLEVSSLRPDCLLSEAPFQVGDKVLSINNTDCTKLSLSRVAKLLKHATGLLTVVVEHPKGDPNLVESMIAKATPTSKTGLGVVQRGTPFSPQMRVSSIDSKGIFASSLLSRRDTILSINGTPCEYLGDASEAAKLVVDSKRTVTILAERKSDNAAVVAQAA